MSRLAARLYPRWWRERYGEEFAALLDDARPGARGTLDILKGAVAMQMTTFSVRILVSGMVAGLLIGLVAAFILKPQYDSVATLQIRDSASRGDAVIQVEKAAQLALSRGALFSLIKKLDLYPQEKRRMAPEDLLELMRRNIRLTPLATQKPSFQIRFEYPDPVVAQRTLMVLSDEFEITNFLLLELPSLPANSSFPNKLTFSITGLIGGTVLGALAALTVHLRRPVKRAA